MDREIEEKKLDATSPVIFEVEARLSDVANDEETQGSDEDDTVENGDGRHIDAGGGVAKTGEDDCDEGEHVAYYANTYHHRLVDSVRKYLL